MTKQETQVIKGVAILLMIFLHLFNHSNNLDLCSCLIYIDDRPIVSILTQASNPVAFFLILGGYGLYKVNIKGDTNRWQRIAKLAIHYWLILIIFLTIGHFMRPSAYPGSWTDILINFTGYETTYNRETWFLLPYVILSAGAPYLFRLMKRYNSLTIIAVTLMVHIATSYCISRYGESFLFNNYWVYTPLLVFHLLFNFSLGAVAARDNFFERLKEFVGKKTCAKCVALIVMVSLVVLACVFKYNFFYAFGVISCLVLAPMPRTVKKILQKLGDNSMNMWMIHLWFCYYLFKSFTYSFCYPILILSVLTIISYLCSLIFNQLTLPIERRFLTKKEIQEKPML